MPDIEKPTDVATQLRRALNAVHDMRTRLEAAEAREHAPVAIVGLACRFPGGADAAAWWRTLASGADAVSLVPPDRWDRDALYDPDPDAPGKMSTRWGGFIEDVDRFDAAFFGISPREAVGIDPQQRLLLETTWHALEDAGAAPDRLAGTRTGVYVGMSTNDYARVLSAGAGSGWIDAHASTGNSVAVAAGRVAYTLGLQGPAMVIDTACSSSLVAVHQAVRALRSGEVGLALAAGVNLTLLPELTIGFSKARMMAADGRCKTFDAAADGYVRGEGCGVVVLKRLDEAIAAGDTLYAVVRGSAVNHDGRSNGLTAPNGPAQVAVIRAALEDARITASHVSLIEAHGTGTSLGDPIEARALAEVYGGERAQPAMLASVKTQVGHLEAAAGIAGLIKLALALRARTIPAHLHFSTLNPHIAGDGFPFRIPVSATPWDPVEGKRIAAVSSFGFSGTNAHVIVEEAPAPGSAEKAKRSVHVLPVSARDAAALEALRRDVGSALGTPGLDLGAFAATLGAGRAHHALRIAVAADTSAAAIEALAKATPVRSAEPPQIAFLFTGQGCQYKGMARALLAEPRFRETLARCDAVLEPRLGTTLAALIESEDGARFERTDVLQPVLLAIEYATADLWRSWGVEPAAVIGHSLGEIAAACFAGAMSLEDALAFVAERGRLMQACEGRGGMAAALAPADKVEALIAGTGATVAGYNAATNTVIAADPAALARALAQLDAAGIATQKLEVATAFHSAALDPILDDLERAAARMATRPARLPIASNRDGRLIHEFDARYWRTQAREPVRFAQGFQALVERGCRVFVEVGPHPVLASFGRAAAPDAAFLASMKRGTDAVRTMSESLAALYMRGAAIDWPARHAPGEARAAAPLYPFQRERHWPVARTQPAAAAPARGLPGERLALGVPQRIYETHVSTAALPFLADHVVFGDVVAPGAMHTVCALAALQREASPAAIEDVVFEQPMTVPAEGLRAQLVFEPDGAFALRSLRGDGEWTQHASGRALADVGTAPAPLDVAALQARLVRDEQGPAALFEMLAERGIVLGETFRGTQALWRGDGEALAQVALSPGLVRDAAALPIHPAMLDACFQALGATFSGPGASGGFLPLSIDRVRAWREAPSHVYCHVRSKSAGAGGEVALGDFTVCDERGAIVMTIEGLQVKRVKAGARDPLQDAYLAIDWAKAPLGEARWADADALVKAAAAAKGDAERDGAGGALAGALERLAEAFAADAVKTLGAGWKADPAKARLSRRVAQLASQHSGRLDGRALARELRDAHPANRAEIDLVARCGEGLAGVLRGETDPLQLLFPAGDDAAGNVYGGAGLAQRANAMAAAAVTEAIARRAGRPLRVIEAGAGTGATTEAALASLGAAPGSTYLFTDVSAAFLKAAQARFGEAIDTAILDLEKSPASQRIPERAFDVVIAANVVHATARIADSLAHLRALLAPGGVLLLVESTRRQQWWDIVFGLTEGWWRFADTELRPDHALLDAAAWQAALARAGFASSAALGADADARLSLIVAEAPPPRVLAVRGGGDGALAESLARELRRRRAECSVAGIDEALAFLARDEARDTTHVVYTGGVTPGTHPEADRTSCDRGRGASPLKDAFELTRAMAIAGRERLLLATRGARGPDAVTEPGEASLWGFGEVAALEHPELRLRRVDIDGDDAAALAVEVLADDGEGAVCWRNGERHVARLVAAALPADGTVELAADGTALVVGAFGGLGPLLAEWLAAHGAGTLVLAGRREPAPEIAARLRALPAKVHLRRVDVTDEGAMAALFAEIRASMPPLRSVFHLAGGTADGAIVAQDWARFASVLGAKDGAARLLDRLCAPFALDHFVMFSTSAALLGNPGQANHAAANACLDALAHARRARGLPALSVNWGAWSGAGAVVEGEHAQAMSMRGARSIAPAHGLAALERAMASGLAQVGVVPLDWPQFLAGYGGRAPAFFEAMAARAGAGRRGGAQARAGAMRPSVDVRARLAEVRPEERLAALEAFLRDEAAAVLGIADAGRIDPDIALNELGLDSLLALELRNRLGAALGEKQPATLLFNYPSIAALRDHLASRLIPSQEQGAPEAGTEDALARTIASMTDAELEALIDKEFEAVADA